MWGRNGKIFFFYFSAGIYDMINPEKFIAIGFSSCEITEICCAV